MALISCSTWCPRGATKLTCRIRCPGCAITTNKTTHHLPSYRLRSSSRQRERTFSHNGVNETQLGDRYEDDRTAVFSHRRAGDPISGRAEGQSKRRRHLEGADRELVGKEHPESQGL